MVFTDRDRIAVLADNLRRAMAKQKMSQEQLESESGVSQATISRILNAKHDPASTVVWRLAQALETSMDKLFEQPTKKFFRARLDRTIQV